MKLHTHTTQLLADTKTPVALYLTLRDLYQNSLLLESSDYNSKDGHYSYICLNPLATVSIHHSNFKTKIKDTIKIEKISNDTKIALDKLTEFKEQFEFETQTLPFCYAGIFGYMGYDCINYAEDIKLKAERKNIDIPELIYSVYGIILVFHHTTNTLYIISHEFSDEASLQQLKIIEEQIQYLNFREYTFSTISDTKSTLTDSDYRAMVVKAKGHCQNGDVFQLEIGRAHV